MLLVMLLLAVVDFHHTPQELSIEFRGHLVANELLESPDLLVLVPILAEWERR